MGDFGRLTSGAERAGSESGRLADSAERAGSGPERLTSGAECLERGLGRRADEPGRPADNTERLAAYDAFARGVRAELAEVGARMDALRAENKVKTATYRQLFATRITLKDIDRRLAERGL